MPQLHQRGVELVLDLLDTAERLDTVPRGQLEKRLRETAHVLGRLLERDHPEFSDPDSLTLLTARQLLPRLLGVATPAHYVCSQLPATLFASRGNRLS